MFLSVSLYSNYSSNFGSSGSVLVGCFGLGDPLIWLLLLQNHHKLQSGVHPPNVLLFRLIMQPLALPSPSLPSEKYLQESSLDSSIGAGLRYSLGRYVTAEEVSILEPRGAASVVRGPVKTVPCRSLLQINVSLFWFLCL